MSFDPSESGSEMSRRVVLRGAMVGGVALPLLAACGSGGGASGAPRTGETKPPPGAENAGGVAPLASTSDMPVGGGKILADEQVVLTQPSNGDFLAFSAVCTHARCLVTTIADGIILCPCHGSQFSITDGSVVGGPAPGPLPKVQITVKGGEITKD